MHDTSSNRGDSRNSSAEAKAITQSPNDFTKFPVARRTDSSSLMTAIVGTLGGVESAFITRKWSPNAWPKDIQTFATLTPVGMQPRYCRHPRQVGEGLRRHLPLRTVRRSGWLSIINTVGVGTGW